MFSGAGGSSCRATVFAARQAVGTEHWIEWKTRNGVTLKSVGLFAAHDAIGLRRSFSDFKLYVKKQSKWSQITEYNPALMYGGNDRSKSCFPLPAKQYAPGSVLAACLNLELTTGQEFRCLRASRKLHRDIFRAAGIATGRLPEV